VARRRLLPLLLAFGALVAGVFFFSQAAAQAPGLERVIVTPGEGTLLTRYQFSGSSFPANKTIAVRLYPPDGFERRLATDDGIELVWLAGPDGAFSLEFVPALRFPGAPAGHWRALFCSYNAPTCQLVEFDVLP
jgi:hypothetical protein